MAGVLALVTFPSPALTGFSKFSPLNGLEDRRGWGAMNKRKQKIMWIARMHKVAPTPAVEIKHQLTTPAAKAV